MSQAKVDTSMLDGLLIEAEGAAEIAKQAHEEYWAKLQKADGLVERFNKKRLEIFAEQFAIQKINWCTYCSEIFPDSEMEFVLIKSRGSRSGGYQNSEYWFETNTELHRACPLCREEIFGRDRSYGPYDTSAHDQASFHAFKVELRDDKYYEEGKLVDMELPKMPAKLFQKLSEDWNILPELYLDVRENRIQNKA